MNTVTLWSNLQVTRLVKQTLSWEIPALRKLLLHFTRNKSVRFLDHGWSTRYHTIRTSLFIPGIPLVNHWVIRMKSLRKHLKQYFLPSRLHYLTNLQLMPSIKHYYAVAALQLSQLNLALSFTTVHQTVLAALPRLGSELVPVCDGKQFSHQHA